MPTLVLLQPFHCLCKLKMACIVQLQEQLIRVLNIGRFLSQIASQLINRLRFEWLIFAASKHLANVLTVYALINLTG